MKINRTDLINAFNIVKAAAGKNEIGGSRTDYLIKDGYLIATNGGVVAQTKIDASENMVIPGKCAGIIKSLPSENITITSKDKKVTLKCEKIINSYKTIPVESYVLPEICRNGTRVFSISSAELKTAIEKVSYAVAAKSTKTVLEGMNVKYDEGWLNFVGLDGFRVAWYRSEANNNGYFDMIIPKNCLDILRGINFENEVNITFNSSWITFYDDNTSISSRLIDGDYLKYDHIFAEGNNKFKINKYALIGCLNRIKAVSEENIAKVELNFKDNKVFVGLMESSVDYSEELEIDNNFELNIVFNANYLLDAIKNFNEDEINISAGTRKSPFIITTNNYKALILPVVKH